MSAIGVGVDLVEVARTRKMLEEKGAHVYDRLLTAAEAEYCRSRPDPAEHVAVRLAAKEAVYKALQGRASGGATSKSRARPTDGLTSH